VVPAEEIGIASSILALARNIAGAFGISVFATILNSTMKSDVLRIAQYSSINSINPAAYAQGVALITLKAQVMSYDTVFIVASCVLLFGAVTSLMIKVGKDAAQTEVMIE
jgi:hypothetical protein